MSNNSFYLWTIRAFIILYTVMICVAVYVTTWEMAVKLVLTIPVVCCVAYFSLKKLVR